MSFWAFLNRDLSLTILEPLREKRSEEFKEMVRNHREDVTLMEAVLRMYCKTTTDCLLAENEFVFQIILEVFPEDLKRERTFWQSVFDSIPDSMVTVRQAWWNLGARDHVFEGKFKFIET